MPKQSKPRVAVVGMGGTISCMGRDSLDLLESADYGQLLEADELLERVPEISTVADVVPFRYRAVSSDTLGPSDWLELNSFVHEVVEAAEPIDGVVITHGTATLEETAYFLNLTLKVKHPVVLVGAQRPVNVISSDASLNLLNAIRVAGDSAARGLGLLVLLNDEIQAAREVTKTSTYRVEAFRSPDIGMLGYADPDGRVVIYRAPTRAHYPNTDFDVRNLHSLPRVDIAYSYAGADGTAIRAFAGHGAKGIVSAGFAPGTTTPAERDAIAEARRSGVLFVQSSHAGSGRVINRKRLRELSLIAADNLTPQKARVLAMLALTASDDPEIVQGFFDQY